MASPLGHIFDHRPRHTFFQHLPVHLKKLNKICIYVEKDRRFLGICLGLQLLFESSEENGPVESLGVIPGRVTHFDSSNGLIVPHIGWNAVQITKESGILNGIEGHHVYFVHSYHAMPFESDPSWFGLDPVRFESDPSWFGLNWTHFGSSRILYAIGLSILKNFLNPSHSSTTKASAHAKASKLAKRVRVRNLGKPVELASQYYKDNVDEVLRYTSKNVFVPLMVGGGIRDFTDAKGRYYSSLEVASEYFRSGADKVSIGSDVVYVAEEYLKTGVKTGKTSLEQISRVYGNQVRMSGAIFTQC
ncbi:Imidazole glycerol phosphate synthase hisHF, chloroplastic [Ananas comosus]|uniref:Imidazole glycerol phosphate synthase hisHF, chloroplastic n=1 Tax=Ananas comosus TaxID=4615 RepID=A0A199UYP8_ANACO|nr:Imidazole glycerol phosphate synthase hisHF, chloroplastic [Ananas comosus]